MRIAIYGGEICFFFLYTLVLFSVGYDREKNSFWNIRFAYLIPSFTVIIAPLVFNELFFRNWSWIIFSFSGCFLGLIVGTWRKFGLFEDNFPPSKEIQSNVYAAHQKLLPEGLHQPAIQGLFNRIGALLGLIATSPLIIIVINIIWLENPGPLFFVKNSVGKGGRNFKQLKFRTMIRDAEEKTGPILAEVNDHRTLKIGKFLRKTAFDEIPQLINILLGDMAFVGPRPQRTVLVEEYLKTLPEFAERHVVLPGLAGLAQIAGSYYITPRQKLRYDRIYVKHASLGFDIKLITLAVILVLWLRWKPDWNGRMPRNWLRICS